MAPHFKHYSFDLWMTLIRSNPSFKLERAKYFHAHYNRQQKSVDEVVAIFRQVDLMCNVINEQTGGNITAEEMYLMVVFLINNDTSVVLDTDANQIYKDVEELLFAFPPQVFCGATSRILQQIREEGGSTISLLSNTAFIKGASLKKVLAEIGLTQYFDFQLYSDEAGMSKPNGQFFQMMLDQLAILRPARRILPHEILHVGDNEKADIYGANSLGISTRLINSNNCCISSILN